MSMGTPTERGGTLGQFPGAEVSIASVHPRKAPSRTGVL